MSARLEPRAKRRRPRRSHSSNANPSLEVVKAFKVPSNGIVYRSDAFSLLRRLADSSADLVFLDPPFNLGKRYSRNLRLDRRPADKYEAWFREILDEACRVLKPGGSLFLYHLPQWAIRFGSYLAAGDLAMRHWIAVSMKNGFVRGKHLYPAHYALLYFTKGKPSSFRRPKIAPARCRHCGDLIKDYGGYWPIVKKKGLNLSDVWDDLSPVRHANRKRRVANELPELLTDRAVHIAGRKNQIFVDPFVGAGTGAISAVKAGMQFIVGDLLKANAQLTAARITELTRSRSKRRQRNGGTR